MMPELDSTTKPEPTPRWRGRTAVAVAALAVAGLVAAAVLPVEPASGQKPARDFYGVVPQTPLESPDITRMQHDRVGMVRQVFFWPEIEPEPGKYNWTTTDDAVRQASAAGIEVFPLLFGTPDWAVSGLRCELVCAPGTPAARQAFARFAAAAVARYGPGGSFWTESPPPVDPCSVPPLLCRRASSAPRPIEAWQVWNEQNSPKYYGPTVNVRQYASLVKQTAKAIRAEDPQAEVVLGGMWGPPGTDAVVPTLRYLKRLYRVRGSRKSFDSIAIHPYAARLENVKGQIRAARELATRVRDRKVGIWVTELGWASGGPTSEPLVKSPREQAALLRKSYRFLIKKRKAWRIRSVHWYSLRDTRAGASHCSWCAHSGLRTTAGAEKPAAAAFRSLPRADR